MRALARTAGVSVLIVMAATMAGCAPDDVVTDDPGTPLSARSPTSTPTPVVTVEVVTTTEAVPFGTTTVEDPAMGAGTEAVTVAGVGGVRTLTYEVAITDGVETSRTLVGDQVTTPPVDQVTSVGTFTPPPQPFVDAEPDTDCDPNYGDGCVPVDSDVDCAGGSGNGPSYVDGPVTVTGADVYDLDRDKDGVGCE